MANPRFRRKSRSGCVDCKARRVKYDEGKPICRRCQRTGRTCIYKSQCSREALKTDSPSTALVVRDGRFDSLDLQLLHHYSTVTAIESFPSPDAKHMWQIYIPQTARFEPLLMHGILAVAGMDLAQRGTKASGTDIGTPDSLSTSRMQFRTRALHHQQVGLALFQECLAGKTCIEVESMLAFSMIIIIATCAQLLTETSRPSLDEFLGVLVLFRGARQVWQLRQEAWRDSPLRPMLYSEDPRQHPSVSKEQIAHLGSFVSRQTDPINRLAAELVLETQQRYAVDTFEFRSIGFWPAICSGSFSRRLRAHDPEALIVLAQYSLLLAAYQDRWWIGDWAMMLLLAIDSMLAENGSTVPEWDLGRMSSLVESA